VSLEKVLGEKLTVDKILFSESHSRYLLVLDEKNIKKLENITEKNNISYSVLGHFKDKKIQFTKNTQPIIDLSVDMAQKTWLNSLGELVMHA
jgi:phosphoribosylformylglycinamidine synthase